MSLFSSIQLANNALRAQQIGLQVVGQNISNANTPGYIREELVLTPSSTQRLGSLLLGLGVDVTAVIQKVDRFVEERLRGAISDRTSAESQEKTYLELESLVGELGDNDLSTSLNKFFASISEIANQPESVAARNLAVLQGQTLAGDINRLALRVGQNRADLNSRISSVTDDANRLIEEIRKLNLRITETEGGVTASDAVGLRDQRGLALAELSKLINIRVTEQVGGAVNVYAGGDYLVFEGSARQLTISQESDRGLTIANVRIAEIDAPLASPSGELHGLLAGRDEILGGFLDTLDGFASTLIFEFNKVFSSGQGLNGYRELTSEFAVDDANNPLDAAGLTFTPQNGSFNVLVYDQQTGLTQTTQILVDLNGLDQDTSLADLAAALDAVDGISANVDSEGKLTIQSDSATQQFGFAADTSGVLAALGINGFFSGTTARGIAVQEAISSDPSKFAASRSGIGVDTENVLDLANFLDRPLDSSDGASLGILYQRLAAETTQASTVSQSVADGAREFEAALEGQHLSISGVSLDEETVRLISYQRAFQASAKYIATLSDLLGILVNL
ncbi:MAG: flagellar hook-associated protein FlgK [Planctomycetes bacterium]|nr:flagellar hook-associated protein FlgK [Planctomycetota bacterium]